VDLTQLFQNEDINLGSNIVDRLELFARLLHEWNQIHNLTGAKSIEKI
jgi:16S rRNA (guanine527-N7)-methyltransferase